MSVDCSIPADPVDYEEGTVLVEEYVLQAGFAKGGRSTIRFATHLMSGESVVLKFCQDIIDYQREVEALRALHEPSMSIPTKNIIKMIDYFDEEEVEGSSILPIIVIEQGHSSLQEVAGNKRPLAEVVFKPILMDVMAGLEVFQHVGLVHCDLKPHNIMFFESSKVHQGIWKLIDFDCASKVGQPVPGISLDFAAPETVLGARSGQPVPASFAVDMFALGQVIHWLASSQSIWGPHPTDASMTHMLCQEEELSISESSYESEPAFALAQGLLLKDPCQRMSLKTLITKSYFQKSFDTRMLANILERRLNIQDDPEGGEDDPNEADPSTMEGMFINYARQVQHQEVRRLWHAHNWGQNVAIGTLRDSLLGILSLDEDAKAKVGPFLSHWYPRAEDEDETDVSTTAINKMFPRTATDISLGDWIIYSTQETHWGNLWMQALLLEEIRKILWSQPVAAVFHRRGLQDLMRILMSVQAAVGEVEIIEGALQLRVLSVMEELSKDDPSMLFGEADAWLSHLQGHLRSSQDIINLIQGIVMSVDLDEIGKVGIVMGECLKAWSLWKEEMILAYPTDKLHGVTEYRIEEIANLDGKENHATVGYTMQLCEVEEGWGEEIRGKLALAAQGDREAIRWMGCAYLDRVDGITWDREKVYGWLFRASALEDPVAITLLSCVHHRMVDHGNAYRYLERAHRLGQEEATSKLGQYYYYGLGRERDVERALELYREALEKGRWEGVYGLLRWCVERGEVEEAEGYARQILEMGSGHGYRSMLMDCLESREGRPKRDKLYAKAVTYCEILEGREDKDTRLSMSQWLLDTFRSKRVRYYVATEVQRSRGVMKFFGLGVPKDRAGAFRLWTEGMRTSRVTQRYVAYCLLTGEGAKRDVGRAMEIMKGDSWEEVFVQDHLFFGYCHYAGLGDEGRNIEKACEIFRKYPLVRSPEARYLYGLCEDEGYRVGGHVKSALKEWEAGEELGSSRCAVALAKKRIWGKGWERDVGRGVRMLKAAVRVGNGSGGDMMAILFWKEQWYDGMEGDVEAMAALGECHMEGLGVRKDEALGMRWLERAVKGGSPHGHLSLYKRYESGAGVPLDGHKAMAYLKGAADLGDAEGMGRYAEYLLGKGGMVEEAMAYAKGSASWGDRWGKHVLARCLLETGKEEEGMRLLDAVARDGDSKAMLVLATRVENRAQAVRYLHQAAAHGENRAMAMLATCYEEGDGVEADKEMARMWRARAEYGA